MKLSVKPISSPGRADKFPPPLMRFLRSNAGSRSRGRSRTSPMFLRKAHHKSSTAAAAAESTQEPSSPKVTCMGQVRVGRSRKPKPRKPGGREADEDDAGSSCCGGTTRCAWISHSLLCHRPAGCRKWRMGRSWSSCSGGAGGRMGEPQPRCVPATRAWSDCGWFFHAAGRPPKVREDESRSSRVETETETEPRFLNELRSEEEESEAGGVRVYVASSSSPCSPPKNALLLTRCRSAPYRSSSLACRFWGSPLNGAGDSQKREESAVEEPKPLLSSDKESRVHPEEEEEEVADDEEEEEDEAEEEERFLKKETAGEIAVPPARIEESEGEEEGRRPSPAPPPRLTRCKSEPARTAAQKVGFR